MKMEKMYGFFFKSVANVRISFKWFFF